MKLARFVNPAIWPFRFMWAVLFLALLSCSCCYSADLVFVRSKGGLSPEQEQLEIASSFYGLNFKVITIDSGNNGNSISKAVKSEETIGVVIAASALAFVNQNALVTALRRKGGASAPLLVLGLTPKADPNLLRAWSGGAVSGCKSLENPASPQYLFGQVDGLTWQLADLKVPIPTEDSFYLLQGRGNLSQDIISIESNGQVTPIFIESTVRQEKLFMACAMPSHEGLADGPGIIDAFVRMAPAMLFTRYCAGERGWHALRHYANLTIDDPWLREPYGYVDYRNLLAEMERHNFHTTIAFIPWNYGRSEAAVVSLFRNHPERFSIAIHGDNHDHKEFTDYSTRSLGVQIADLKQSLARMKRFQELTGIPYDKVMIFPHSIAPERTLAALKTYNYLATVNSRNVPQDDATPAGLSFYLRPVTLSYGGLPSLGRYSTAAPLPKDLIAINEFLDNPLLFYCHSDFFAKGIGAFDGLADEVNKLEPDTRWRSLGSIVKHLYLVKLRDDSNYDVLAFSSNISLDNVSRRNAIFYVRKQEIGGQAIDSVTVDGKPYEYHLQDGYLDISVPVASGKSRVVEVQYKNDLELATIDVSHHSLIVYLLRMGSDFRDIYLSKFPGGLAFISFYNDHELRPAPVLGFLLAFISLCVYVAYRLRGFVRGRRSTSQMSNV